MHRITGPKGLPQSSPPPQIPLDARLSEVRAVHGTHDQTREIDIFKAIRLPAHDSFLASFNDTANSPIMSLLIL